MSLLDKMVKKYKIPAWPYEAVYDRIIVFSVPEDAASRETFSKGGILVKTQREQSVQERQTPRGIIVSAGLEARDILKSHGMDLGHMVWVARLSPWRHEVDHDEKGPIEFLFLRVGDLVGSETLQEALREKKLTTATGEDGRMRFVNGKGTPVGDRVDPPSYVA